jgi:hypothetical protein
MKEEIPAGINTGIIRAMGGSGSVVTAAGLVFAFTMMSMSVSAMVVVAQMGTTIGLGLLFATLVIRAFMTPSIAALLGSLVPVAAGRARPARAGKAINGFRTTSENPRRPASAPIVYRSTSPDEGAADGQHRQDPTDRPAHASRAPCHMGSGRHFRRRDCSGRDGVGGDGPVVELCSIRPDLRNRHYGKFDGRRGRARMWCSSARLVSRRVPPARRPR